MSKPSKSIQANTLLLCFTYNNAISGRTSSKNYLQLGVTYQET